MGIWTIVLFWKKDALVIAQNVICVPSQMRVEKFYAPVGLRQSSFWKIFLYLV